MTYHKTIIFEYVHLAHWTRPVLQQPWVDAVFMEFMSGNINMNIYLTQVSAFELTLLTNFTLKALYG